MPEIIAFSNQKGGVGKTTTAVNVAACLGATGHSTLLVDLDPQGNASSAVGLDPNNLPANIYDALMEEIALPIFPTGTACPGLRICPAAVDLAGAEFDLMDMERREFRLQEAFSRIEEDFDYVIIDCPPSLGLLTVNALAVADWVMVPVQAEYLALEGLSRIMMTIQRVNRGLNPDLQLLGVAVTMFDGRTNLANQVVEEIERAFPGRLFRTKIRRSVRLSEAPSFGQPIIYYDSGSVSAYQYLTLSEEILDVCQKARTGTGA